MSARTVLEGLRSVEWKRGYTPGSRPLLCPVCGGHKDGHPDERGHDEGCALDAAIAYFEEEAKTADAKVAARHCDGTLCKQWGDASGNCNCPCTPCVDADAAGRHRTLAEHV